MPLGATPGEPPLVFADRRAAGRALARRLQHYARRCDVVVLGLPRGGVPVAFEVARALGAPLDVFVVRKLGVPGREELAMGALASGGVCRIDARAIGALEIKAAEIEACVARERRELERRERAYRRNRPLQPLLGRSVILVDDGLATGASMRAALAALRAHAPQRIVSAIPVAPRGACRELEGEADEVVCLATPEPFVGVSAWYEDFSQTTDAEVRALLVMARIRAWKRRLPLGSRA